MLFEINKLINSEFPCLEELGWLLYNREDQNGGLTKEELDNLLRIINVEALEEEYQDGFNDGLAEREV